MAADDKKRLDIFETLSAIDRNDKNYYKNLSEEDKKLFAGSVILRWLSTVSDKSGLSEYYCLMTQKIANEGFWELSKHPHLQYLLMTIVGCGKKMNHQWIPMSKKIKRRKVDELFLMKHPNINEKELELLWKIYSSDDVKQLARDYALDDKYITELVNEFETVKE